MNVAFSAVLSVMSTFCLLGIVSIHRASEDPFLWRYPGNSVDVALECRNLKDELALIAKESLKRYTFEDAQAPQSSG